jgi:hypothetical protein
VIPVAADEAPHAPPASAAWDASDISDAALSWSEVWQLDAANDDGAGLTVRLECFPAARVAWFWTYLVLPDRRGPIVVRDHEVTLPRQGLEIRAEGLWAELWCETPLEHWTYGLEAFAVALDDPSDALAGEIGERLPVGLDLEWEIAHAPHGAPDDWPVASYVIPGIVHGDVLLGRERFEFDGRGEHVRSWGPRRPHPIGAWSLACSSRAITLHVDGRPDGSVDGFVELAGAARQPARAARREVSAGEVRVVLDEGTDGTLTEIEAEVIGGAPVPIDAHARFDRALCRVAAGDAVGYGWSSTLEAP